MFCCRCHQVLGVLGAESTRSEDRIRRSHPSRSLSSAHQSQEKALRAHLTSGDLSQINSQVLCSPFCVHWNLMSGLKKKWPTWEKMLIFVFFPWLGHKTKWRTPSSRTWWTCDGIRECTAKKKKKNQRQQTGKGATSNRCADALSKINKCELWLKKKEERKRMKAWSYSSARLFVIIILLWGVRWMVAVPPLIHLTLALPSAASASHPQSD